MEASLALVGCMFGLLAWQQTAKSLWLYGAVALVMNWPYTRLLIRPTNNHLMAPDSAGPTSRTL
jgi:hypothetical protein